MEEKKVNSTNKLLIVLVVLLSLLVGGFGGYIVFSHISKNDSKNFNKIEGEAIDKDKHESGNKDNIDEEIVKDLSLDSTIVQTLSDKVIGVYTNNLLSKYEDYFYKNDKVILVDEDITFKLSLAAETISDYFKRDNFGYNCDSGVCGVSYIDEDSLKQAYYSLFGNNTTYTRESFNLSGCTSSSNYTWSSVNNRYETKIPDGCGGTVCGGTISKLAYAKQITSSTVDKIEIYEYFYKEVCGDNINYYYSDYNKNNLIGSTTNLSNPEDVFTKYTDKLGQYKYTFVKDSDGIYVFTSVEKVK